MLIFRGHLQSSTMNEANYISYKDPSAQVVLINGEYYRYIYVRYKEEYDHLMQSGLYRELTNKNLLLAHKEIKIDQNSKIYKILSPDQIYFKAYPFEWSYSQWKKAIIAFLDINIIAVEYGMILKDATPFNFYFQSGEPIMFDTTSFSFFHNNDKWLAYKQFCEEFLSPFALMHYGGQNWSKMSISHLHGFPLEFVSYTLPIKSWLNFTCLINIHIHAKFINNIQQKQNSNNSGFSQEKIKFTFSLIKNNISTWKVYNFKSNWVGYYENSIESNIYLQKKEDIVRIWIKQIGPFCVIDLGANTGKFSFIAAEYCTHVIAIESDGKCVEKIGNKIIENKIKNIDTLVCDLAEMTPDLGILNKEYKSLYHRTKSDFVLGLALIHHLCIGKNISLKLVANLFSEFTTNYAIVEFITKDDKRVIDLIKGREDLFDNYNEETFYKEFSEYFDLIKVEEIMPSMRKLFLWKKK